MADNSGTYQRASVLDAARILGVSPTMVRRMVKAGEIRDMKTALGLTLI